jgi:hypothetical protein
MEKKKKSTTFGPKHGAAEKISPPLPQDHLDASILPRLFLLTTWL